jgi:hypothetical protein
MGDFDEFDARSTEYLVAAASFKEPVRYGQGENGAGLCVQHGVCSQLVHQEDSTLFEMHQAPFCQMVSGPTSGVPGRADAPFQLDRRHPTREQSPRSRK